MLVYIRASYAMMPVDCRKRMSIITGTTKRTMTAYSCLRRNAAPLLSPPSCRTIGLAFARTTNSVVAQTLLGYMQQRLA